MQLISTVYLKIISIELNYIIAGYLKKSGKVVLRRKTGTCYAMKTENCFNLHLLNIYHVAETKFFSFR